MTQKKNHMKCRFCGQVLTQSVVNLGNAPYSNAYLTEEELLKPETFYPLHVMVCDHCWLVQTVGEFDSKDIFHDQYAYFSSYSSTWLNHAKKYTDYMCQKYSINQNSLVCEVASNDGYLLQYFQQAGIPNYGIEPVTILAQVAKKNQVHTIQDFFTFDLAKNLSKSDKSVDLLIANNVLAHVPDIVDFIKASACLLKKTGFATFEFPSLLQLLKNTAFDTIYHEHYSYLSVIALKNIFDSCGLSIFRVDDLSSHGGSYRVYVQHTNESPYAIEDSVSDTLKKEKKIQDISYYATFQQQVDQLSINFIKMLGELSSKKIIAYGAAAKGNTLLNYCGIRPNFLPAVVDKNPNKIGNYMPGSHIPILTEDIIIQEKPDYILILPWNITQEITQQLKYIKNWGGQFITVIPHIRIF